LLRRRICLLAASPLRRLAPPVRVIEPRAADRPLTLARAIYIPPTDSSTVTPLYNAYGKAISDSTGARRRIILVTSLGPLPPRHCATHLATLDRRNTMFPAHSADFLHTFVHISLSASHAAASLLDARIMSSALSTLTLAARDSSAPLDDAEPEFSESPGHSSAESLQLQGQAFWSRDG
jgi:hypothetical protein